jgi:hypothetical protein
MERRLLKNAQSSGRHLHTFYLLTVTQVLSIVGSIMTHTAVGIRVFSDTGALVFVLTACVYAWSKTRSVEADLLDYAAVADG